MSIKGISLKKTVVLMAAVAGVSGCAQHTAFMDSIQPVERYTGRTAPASEADPYATGSAHFRAGRYGLAVQHFQRALARNRDSVQALNGLGAAFDKIGRYEIAQAYYYRALALDGGSLQTLNNLGYSLFLQKRYGEAVQVLTTASRKEGANPRVRRNLVQAQEHLFAELGRKDRNTPEPAQPQKTALAREPEQRPRQAPPSVEPEVPEYDVEIANGNGRNGMAYLTSRYLEQEGVRVAEISNAAHFGYEETAVYYAPGYEAAARQVASLLRLPVALEELPAARLPAKVRVVLGEDFMVYDRALRTAALADTDAGAAGDPGASDTGVLTAAVEVSNGNGRTGMAALVGRALRADGRVVGRLTNADSFSIPRTTVYYRPGGRKEAERVARSLPVEAAVEESGAMRRDIGVRVVIGRDILDHETEIRNQTSEHA